MKTWSVKYKGRIERLIVFYLVLTLLIVSLFAFALRRSHVNLSELDPMDIFFGFILSSFFLVPIIVITYRKIMATQIPKEIIFDSLNGYMLIRYSIVVEHKLLLEHLAYSFNDASSDHKSITFYKIQIGSRGQKIYKETLNLIGLRYSFSWKASQIQDIVNVLKQTEVEVHKSSNEKMSLFDKLMSS